MGAEQDHETRKDEKVKEMESCYGNVRCEERTEVARAPVESIQPEKRRYIGKRKALPSFLADFGPPTF